MFAHNLEKIKSNPLGRNIYALAILYFFISSPVFAACTISITNNSGITAQGTFSGVAAGSTICFAPGTYTVQLPIINAHGTSSAHIQFVVGPTAGVATFTSGVLLRNASYIDATGFTVSLPTTNQYAAVILDTGTNNSSINGFTVQNSYVGISVGSYGAPAGISNNINGNLVQNNWNTGIAIGALSDGSASGYNYIQNNSVVGNGGHGIESTDANYAIITENLVSGNGTGINSAEQGGYSGIHLYASAATNGSSPNGVRCTGNIVANNSIIGTLERSALSTCSDGTGSGHCADGNGIQIDRYCSYNNVYSNVSLSNAGNGISVYGASNNTIRDNHTYENNKQVSRRTYFPGPAEISISAIGLTTGSASGNVIYNNTAITTLYQIPAFYESANAGTNTVGPKNIWLWTSQSTPDASWGPVYLGTTWYSTSSSVNTATGTTGNIAGLPPQ